MASTHIHLVSTCHHLVSTRMSVLGIILHLVCQIRRFVLHLNLSSRGISGLDAGGGQWGAVGMSGGQYGKSPITGGDKLANSMRNGDLSGRLSTDGGVVRGHRTLPIRRCRERNHLLNL